MYTPYSEPVFNFRGQVQGFIVGAAVVAGIMLAAPAVFAAPTPTLPTAPLTDGDQIAAAFNVKVVWDISNCTKGEHPKVVLGCTFASDPSTIYINPVGTPERKHRTVLHELGHVVQARLGLEHSECNADKFADALQAPVPGYNCY